MKVKIGGSPDVGSVVEREEKAMRYDRLVSAMKNNLRIYQNNQDEDRAACMIWLLQLIGEDLE